MELRQEGIGFWKPLERAQGRHDNALCADPLVRLALPDMWSNGKPDMSYVTF
jgi:hypothetical protein